MMQTFSEGQCRKRIGNVRNTTKKTLYCPSCDHVSYVDGKICQCCMMKIKTDHRYVSSLKRFDKIIQDPVCAEMIQLWNYFPTSMKYRPKFHIKMGHQIFAVSIKHMAEYQELVHLESDGDKYTDFINSVKKASPLVAIDFTD